jgi:hypothetical protein
MTGPDLRDLRVPGEEDARRRAWSVARAALAERAPAGRRRALRARGPALAAVGLLAAIVLGLALTAPGRATAQWVQDRIADAVDRRPAAPHPKRAPTYGPLPGGGRLLAVEPRGPVVLGLGPPRQLTGPVDDAAWSPYGRFVVAVRGHALLAVDLRGRPRWRITARGPIRAPRWAPSGFRVAYLSGEAGSGGRLLRVVNGDGTGDRAIAAARATPPAWHPGTVRHVLAHVDAAGRIAVRDVDTGAVLWRARPREIPRRLAWSRDGHRLLAIGPAAVTAYAGGSGRVLGRRAAPRGTENVTGAFAPYGRRYVVVRRVVGTGDHRLLLVAGGRERLLQVGTGALYGVAWSPDGRWLALDVAGAHAWTLMRLRDGGPDAVRTLAAGRAARLAGWCCGPTP